ncbi:MAG: hypothetical protein M0030_20535 [Actinomycetota bacterium]|nr:hypothetical protein [Actinomycetota bacterium]
MRKRFTRAFYAVSAAAAITASLSLGAGAASAATTSHNGTVACGGACINVFSTRLGSNVTLNAYVPGDTGAGGTVGTKVNLHLASNDRPNGDFIPTAIGQVYEFCGVYFNPVSYPCLNYPHYTVFEVQFTPNGYGMSNLCAGVRTPSYQGENVTLQPCGQSAATLWIADRGHAYVPTGYTGIVDCRDSVTSVPVAPGDPSQVYCPWINGSDPSFSNPLVLTLNTGTTRPTNQLMLEHLQLLSGSAVSARQLFAFFYGAVPF